MKEKKPEKQPGSGGNDGPDGNDLESLRKNADDLFADIGDLVNNSVSEDPAEFLSRARQSGGQ